MTILRIHKKQNNFVILDKTCLNDEKLSWGAKGLHAHLISMPDNWQVRVSDLQKRATNGRDAVRAFLNELENAGYIKKSIRRNEKSGQFGGMEFLVLEKPEPEIAPNTPEPEKASAVDDASKTPKTENPSAVLPATGNPSTGNPTLISINRINNKRTNKTAADPVEITEAFETPKAAVIFPLKKALHPVPKQKPPTQVLSTDDVLIGEMLTSNQSERIQELVDELNIVDQERLRLEIHYCLLNKNHFTGCGKDFSKKLNAIRRVILRGDWQTPAGMLVREEKCAPAPIIGLQKSLLEAKAEETHFSRLLLIAKEEAKAQLIQFVSRAQQKIKEVEKQISQFMAFNEDVKPSVC